MAWNTAFIASESSDGSVCWSPGTLDDTDTSSRQLAVTSSRNRGQAICLQINLGLRRCSAKPCAPLRLCRNVTLFLFFFSVQEISTLSLGPADMICN
jgi:hypothetical protein